MALQSIWAAILNAITLGIIFARISQPKQRARTIFISDSAVVARRDGMLKFMFRVADIRATQVSHLMYYRGSCDAITTPHACEHWRLALAMAHCQFPYADADPDAH